MITPRFEISQCEQFVELKLHCPFIKAQNVEIDISGTSFRFYCKPYFLRLTFPNELTENGTEKSSYDIGSGQVYLKLPKLIPGMFKDLDLLTKLLDIKKITPSKNTVMIQEIGETITMQDDDDDELDWNFEQTLRDTNVGTTATYGFNNLYQNYGDSITELAQEFLDVKNLDQSTLKSRRDDRLLAEELKFDDEYYMYDFGMNEDIQALIDYKPSTWKLLKRVQKEREAGEEKISEFSDNEKESLLNLPNKQYLIDQIQKPIIYLGLVDILLAYSYDHRVSEGDQTVESCWNICRLSGTISAFDSFHNLEELLNCFIRRAISFPLYRNFKLCAKVVEDVVILLKLGKKEVLKVLLAIKECLMMNENTVVIDRLFVEDYCVWVQSCSEKRLKSLASELNHFDINTIKNKCGWDLDQLENIVQTRLEVEVSE
jgi:protein SHQ1